MDKGMYEGWGGVGRAINKFQKKKKERKSIWFGPKREKKHTGEQEEKKAGCNQERMK